MNKVKIIFYIKDVHRPLVLTYKSTDSEDSIQKTIAKLIENNKLFELRSNVTDDIIMFRSEDVRCILVTKTGEMEKLNEPDNHNLDK